MFKTVDSSKMDNTTSISKESDKTEETLPTILNGKYFEIIKLDQNRNRVSNVFNLQKTK